uniref:Uncharacterized protein n=1 Tax=Cacopsylla melanoneura TaxID=428564 RepID=A0A8D9BI47_9HEMI
MFILAMKSLICSVGVKILPCVYGICMRVLYCIGFVYTLERLLNCLYPPTRVVLVFSNVFVQWGPIIPLLFSHWLRGSVSCWLHVTCFPLPISSGDRWTIS